MAREVKIIVRATKEEKAMAEKEARKVGMSVSAFIRLLIRQWSDGIKFEREKISIQQVPGKHTGEQK